MELTFGCPEQYWHRAPFSNSTRLYLLPQHNIWRNGHTKIISKQPYAHVDSPKVASPQVLRETKVLASDPGSISLCQPAAAESSLSLSAWWIFQLITAFWSSSKPWQNSCITRIGITFSQQFTWLLCLNVLWNAPYLHSFVPPFLLSCLFHLTLEQLTSQTHKNRGMHNIN